MPRKSLRVALLLAVLALTVTILLDTRVPPPPDWDEPLRVVIYPYNADGSQAVADHIADRRLADFLPVEDFFAEQAARYGLGLERPFELALGAEIEVAPTAPPRSRNLLTRARWGLSVRWWHFRFRDQVNKPDIIVVARYHNPNELPRTMHSIAIAAQRLAVAKLVADDLHNANNHVVLAHEILHTVGAGDLYDPATGLPLYPEGYADPNRTPLHPQHQAEIMAGRIPLTPFRSREAISLHETLIGPATAREINWPTNPPE
ncbi:hypothetical protein IC757_04720 [Wenzhouxiangella sp. AB-CW3]|uniref:hypothetical protein n=1 Tax=Wenzhouxiangella sp. AB-CW3 TaxID=2771012 RepID=UPI00168AF250|nr:hypothetical protein [Wenzhouxiangella sp. AB-CW3]QOC23449.1 hypothetical protein IC757_04720 [Wenzhouxiangella sp. AB-CW3]